MSTRERLGERRLSAIMFTDVVGFSAMASRNEERTLILLGEQRKLLEGIIAKYGGLVVKSTGDGFLVEFSSAVQAVNCSAEMQQEVKRFNSERKEEEAVVVKIGIHVGDVFHSAGDIMGDAVNVAARVQPLADAGGVCVTKQVVDQVQRKVKFGLVSMGVRELKNIGYPVEVYKVVQPSTSSMNAGSQLDPHRVAILPLTNMSPDPNDRYFADGMTEELISTISKISELQVISRTSMMRYRDTTLPLTQIGQELAAGSILEGSVRKAGNRVRITTQLIAVDGDRHVWSQSYDRDLNDVFAVQADIAEKVADSLKVQLVSGEKQRLHAKATDSSEAYTLYLKGRFYWNERTEDGTKTALRYFESAAKIDPGFAMAYAGIADSYNILSDYGWLSEAEAAPLARSNAMRALELDDGLAEAHAALGLILMNQWDFALAEREFKRAIELKPNYSPARHWYSILLFQLGRQEESDAIEDRALEVDPHSPVVIMGSAMHLREGKFFVEWDKFDRLLQEFPRFGGGYLFKSVSLVADSKFEQGLEAARKFVEVDAGSAASKLQLAWVYAAWGKNAEAQELVDEVLKKPGKGVVSPTKVGWILLLMGKTDEGFMWLNRAYEKRETDLLGFRAFPFTERFRSDPRWAEIEQKIALPRV